MVATPGLSLEQFLQLEETKPASEYVRGEVIQKPMPNFDHSAIQFFLAVVLGPFLSRTGLGRGLTEFHCIFGPPGGERAFVPDLVYVARDRLTGEPHLHVPPDLAVEILSPDQDMGRFLDKIQFYLVNGVRLIWVIDPMKSTIAVLLPGKEGRILVPGDTLDGGDVLPGFSLEVGEIFAQMRV